MLIMSLVVSGGETVTALVSMVTQLGQSTGDAEGGEKRLMLETEYFSAEVLIHTALVTVVPPVLPPKSIPGNEQAHVRASDGYESMDADHTKGADSFIFTMSAEEAAAAKEADSTPQDLHDICGLAEECDVPIRILNIIGKEPLSEESTMHWIGWSLDHGFEFIFIDSSDLMATADEREKEGLPRLLESLHSHQWSSMVPKSSSGSSGSGSGSSRGGEVEQQQAGDVFQFHDQAVVEEEGEGEGEEDGSKKKSVGVAMKGNPFLAGVEPSDDETKDDGLDQLMAQARQLRELVDTGNLSDAERRDKAAAFAMKFASMVDLGDEDDSDEEEEEEE